MTCRMGNTGSDTGHVWAGGVKAGDPCGCGAMRIAQTVETGTWLGMSVMSWEPEYVDGTLAAPAIVEEDAP